MRSPAAWCKIDGEEPTQSPVAAFLSNRAEEAEKALEKLSGFPRIVSDTKQSPWMICPCAELGGKFSRMATVFFSPLFFPEEIFSEDMLIVLFQIHCQNLNGNFKCRNLIGEVLLRKFYSSIVENICCRSFTGEEVLEKILLENICCRSFSGENITH